MSKLRLIISIGRIRASPGPHKAPYYHEDNGIVLILHPLAALIHEACKNQTMPIAAKSIAAQDTVNTGNLSKR